MGSNPTWGDAYVQSFVRHGRVGQLCWLMRTDNGPDDFLVDREGRLIVGASAEEIRGTARLLVGPIGECLELDEYVADFDEAERLSSHPRWSSLSRLDEPAIDILNVT